MKATCQVCGETLKIFAGKCTPCANSISMLKARAGPEGEQREIGLRKAERNAMRYIRRVHAAIHGVESMLRALGPPLRGKDRPLGTQGRPD